MHHDEFALSKDTTVSVWIDFREFYGEDSLREVCNGDFVVVNECLHSEFDKFRQKLFSILNGRTPIKATALMNIWMKACNLSLKFVNVLGGIYYLISPSEIDDFCQWIYDARDRCFDGGVTMEKLLSSQAHGNSIEIVDANHTGSILFQPTCSAWQQEKCRILGLSFIRSNYMYIKRTECVKIGIEQAPSATYRIKGDGNCFFRSLSQVLTGSQDVHEEVRLLVTSFMEHNATIPEFAGMLVSNESMEQYLKRTKMQSLNTWATEMEIMSAVAMLNTTIYCFSPCGLTYKWLRHSPKVVSNRIKQSF